MIKVAVVGVGGISGAHIPIWAEMEDAQLVALCDVRKEQMEKYPDYHHYTDIDEMLDKEELDILDICLPTYLHADFAVKALNRGIHVLTEKPISLKREDVARVYAAAEANHVKFMVAHVLRFWPEFLLVKELYESKKYGKLLSGFMRRLGNILKSSWDNWMKDENRSGLVPFDLHIHDSDFLVYAFGKPENMVVHRSKRPEQDYICAIYEYPDFFITTEAAWYAGSYPFTPGYRFQFEGAVVEMEKGMIKVYESNGTVLNLSEGHDGDIGDMTMPKSDAYANEIQYFADCVRKDKPVEKMKPEELETVIDILKKL